ncbi:MAG: MltA domain-containing protein [Proteobacteria bacterium]|nr:MltA domain-containing protein [Pseudomonadota bacterium]
MMRAWIANKPLLIVLFCTLSGALALWRGTISMNERAPALVALAFSGIGGWEHDDHGQAFATFRRSCERIVQVAGARAKAGKGDAEPHSLREICEAALVSGEKLENKAARAFFEKHFTPYRTSNSDASGFVTGYFEPELPGARVRSKRFSVPVYRIPRDLVQLIADAERAARNHEMTYARNTAQGHVPYYERKEIEQGALDGAGLEILYLASWTDAFFVHVQGSARVALDEGGHVRLAFAAKNGHPYTSIGKLLVARGVLSKSEMSMAVLRAWLEANPRAAREVMWQNRSYIFFRERTGPDADAGPVGAQGVVLTARRSLAIDTSLHALGTPIWVNAPELDVHGGHGFRQLMIAQDAGSAIKGAGRGDIYWGTGAQAGDIAGATRHKAEFILLLPNGKYGP